MIRCLAFMFVVSDAIACLVRVVVFPEFRVSAALMATLALFPGVFRGVMAEFVATLVSSDVARDVTYLFYGDVSVTVQ